ncbi:MAG: exosortase-associated EpsI family protein [Armatimonas sp.]
MQTPTFSPEKSIAIMCVAALTVSYFWKAEAAPAFAGLSQVTLPKHIGTFVRSGPLPIDPLVRSAIPTADIRRQLYSLPTGEDVELTLIAGRDRDSLHDPRSCMVGAGWRIEDDRVELLPGTSVSLRRCTLAQGTQRFDVLYGYVADGKVLAEPTQIRGRMLAAALLGRRGSPVCFFRLLRPTGRISADKFDAFAAELWGELHLETRF